MTRFPTACVVSVMVAMFGAAAQAGPAEMAERAYAEGIARLADADFDGALTAFKAAARNDRQNAEYTRQYVVLRQIQRLRETLPNERDADVWMQGAAALSTFYHEHGLFGESLPLDQERFRRDPSAKAAAMLARTQLALGSHAAAATLLASLPTEQRSDEVRVLHGLALVRGGNTEDAKAFSGDPSEPADTFGPTSLYELACLRALVGQSEAALQSLTRSLELTPPSQLVAFKARIRGCADFAGLSQSDAFAEVLKTASKVQESPCSGGTGCGKCPKREKCGTAKPAKAEN